MFSFLFPKTFAFAHHIYGTETIRDDRWSPDILYSANTIVKLEKIQSCWYCFGAPEITRCEDRNSKRLYGNGSGMQIADMGWSHRTHNHIRPLYSSLSSLWKQWGIFQYCGRPKIESCGDLSFWVGWWTSSLPLLKFPVSLTSGGSLSHACQRSGSFVHLSIYPYSFWICAPRKGWTVSA